MVLLLLRSVLARAAGRGGSSAHAVTNTTRSTGITHLQLQQQQQQRAPLHTATRLLSTKIRVATILERYPLCQAPPTEFEKAYFDFACRVRVEKAALSYEEYDRLRRAQETAAKSKKKKKGKKALKGSATTASGADDAQESAADSSKDAKSSFFGAAQDSDESRQLTYTPAPHTTADDEAANTRSLNRNLPGKLYFVVKETADGPWSFPTVERDVSAGASLRKSAEEALQQVLSPDATSYYFLGNAPSLHTNVSADTDLQAPTFFYRCIYLRGEHTPSHNVADYAWLTKAELEDKLGLKSAVFAA